jgi:hypothetical protein
MDKKPFDDRAHTYFVAPGGDDSNPGSFDLPWRSPEHAAAMVEAGQTVLFRAGTYVLRHQAVVRNPGSAGAWIVLAGYPGEEAILDASQVLPVEADRPHPYRREQGALHLENTAFIRIQNLTVKNSHWAGICVLNSQYVDLINNRTDGSFSSGISIWDTTRRGVCHHHRVLGNTVVHATTWDMISAGYERGSEPPHEAISISGAHDFEVAYNHVYDCDKEGIDVKETSKRGIVHHNYVHHVRRQGLYADAWFGVLEDVEFSNNVVHDCCGSGMALSTEDVEIVRNISIHYNLIYNNWGPGIYMSRWGVDGPRASVRIFNNTIYNNGYGQPNPGEAYYYITGGIYFYSDNLQDFDVYNNIISENNGFQVGYSAHYLKQDPDVETAFRRRGLRVVDNLIYDPKPPAYPIHFGWPGHYADAYGWHGARALLAQPCFADLAADDFRLAKETAKSSQADIGAFPAGSAADFWWRKDFPPRYNLPD